MVSGAYAEWSTTRCDRLDQLEDAHRRIEGDGRRGRRYRTEQLNWALVLRIAAEFQGFSRDLYDESVEAVLARVGQGAHTILLRDLLTRQGKLDQGNASSAALSKDFGRLGIQFWPALQECDHLTEKRQRHLELLMTARNGIAHADEAKLKRAADAGFALSRLSSARRWRNAIERLACTMDECLGTYIGRVFGGGNPW